MFFPIGFAPLARNSRPCREGGAVVLGDAVLRRGAVAGAIQRSATVFTPVVPASWLELALHVVAGQRSAMMHS